jgi:hypothetical protein
MKKAQDNQWDTSYTPPVEQKWKKKIQKKAKMKKIRRSFNGRTITGKLRQRAKT